MLNPPYYLPRTPTFQWRPLIAMLCLGFVKPVCFDVIFPFISTPADPLCIATTLTIDRSNGPWVRRCWLTWNCWVLFRDYRVDVRGTQRSDQCVLHDYIFSFLILHIVVPWTYASDRYGRKPVAMYGIIGMSIATATFGFSKTFGMMIITRCIGGAFAGTRSYVSSSNLHFCNSESKYPEQWK